MSALMRHTHGICGARGLHTKMLSGPYSKRVSGNAPIRGHVLGTSCIRIPDAGSFVEIGFFQM